MYNDEDRYRDNIILGAMGRAEIRLASIEGKVDKIITSIDGPNKGIIRRLADVKDLLQRQAAAIAALIPRA